MTSPMDAVFKDVGQAPDFTVLSLYKIFGFPDLGVVVVRKASGHILALRKYFGGGTVTMVSTLDNWHQSKALQPSHTLHDGLEDGTLPFHSILALGEAIDVHAKLYGSMKRVSAHTAYLVARLRNGLSELRHENGSPLCRTYCDGGIGLPEPAKQGPVIAFNVLRADGWFVPYSDVDKAAIKAGIYIRSGGRQSPGAISNTGTCG